MIEKMAEKMRKLNDKYAKNGGFVVVSKTLVNYYKEAAILMLSYLIDIGLMKVKLIDEKGFYPVSRNELSTRIGISKSVVSRNYSYLLDQNLIEKQNIRQEGNKSYIKINVDKIEEILVKSFKKEKKLAMRKEKKIDMGKVKERNNIKKKKVFKSEIIELLEFSNNLKNTPNHKLNLKSPTKLILKILEYIDQLEKGKFFEKKEIDVDWLKKNNVSLEKATKKFTLKEIKKAILRFNKCLSEEYFPDNKYLPKTLKDFFYNDRSGKSFFLKFVYNRPQKKSSLFSIKEEKVENIELKEVEKQGVLKYRREFPNLNLNGIKKMVVLSYQKWKNLEKLNTKTNEKGQYYEYDFWIRFSKFVDVIDNMIEVIRDYGFEKISVGHLNPDGKIWEEMVNRFLPAN